MFAKSTQMGFVSLFAVVAMALGGCAESTGAQQLGAPPRTVTAFPDTTISAAPPAKIDTTSAKTARLEGAATQFSAKAGETAVARSGGGYRTDGCGH